MDTAYSFPPTVWQLQEWSLLEACVLFALLAAAIVTAARWQGAFRYRYIAAAFAMWFTCRFWKLYSFGNDLRMTLGSCMNAAAISLAMIVVTYLVCRHRSGVAKSVAASTVGPLLGFCFVVMLSGVTYPHAAARRTQCRNNLKQIGLALHRYHGVWSTFPAAYGGTPPVSWRVNILPFLDQTDVFDCYDQNSAWDSDANSKAAKTMVRTFQCPTRVFGHNKNQVGQFLTSYLAVTGPNTIFEDGEATRIRSVTDGLSNTLMVVEACGTDVVWTEPRDTAVDALMRVNTPTDRPHESKSVLSSYHTGGAQGVFGDGSARFISENVDPKVLNALFTINGGEELGDDYW